MPPRPPSSPGPGPRSRPGQHGPKGAPRRPGTAAGPGVGAESAPRPLASRDIEELQQQLDAVPPPLEPLDLVMLDGYLCGVLLQPERVPLARWWPAVIDGEGRPLPAAFDVARLRSLVQRRHAELDRSIQGRRWFDPWVFELEEGGDLESKDEADPGEPASEAAADQSTAPQVPADHDPSSPDPADELIGSPAASAAVYPWVAGFATALEAFPALLAMPDDALTEPLALVYRHLDPDDLEEAEDLLEEIEQIGPPSDLADAVEGLVRAVLLLADVTRPIRNRSR